VACLLALERVIAGLLTLRILDRFVGQVATCPCIRSRSELRPRLAFVMPVSPLPALVALVAWLYVFGTTVLEPIVLVLVSLGAGVVAFAALRSAGDPSE
jgi:hypothetical protein